MRETRSYGSEGGESGTTGLPYPYQHTAPLGALGALCLVGLSECHEGRVV
jgi:hypothetical protein